MFMDLSPTRAFWDSDLTNVHVVQILLDYLCARMNYEKQRFQVQTYFWITQWVPKYQENQTGTWSKKSLWRQLKIL